MKNSVKIVIFTLIVAAIFGGALLFSMKTVLRSPSAIELNSYRIEIETPGGPLPFRLDAELQSDQPGWFAKIHNGIHPYGVSKLGYEEFPVDMTGGSSELLIVEFPHYDARIELEPDSESEDLNGFYIKNRGSSGIARLPLVAKTNAAGLFDSESSNHWKDFSGSWSVKFDSSEDQAVGKFDVWTDQSATGTFMTTTGDYRYLAGRVDGNLMRLSTFDGAHAFLFHARMQDDGTIEGDFWSGNWYHDTWTAVRDDDATLPDAFEQTVIADEDALGEMVFKNLEGQPMRVLDVLDESNAPARIIEIFGTWCPNCSDAGRELVSLREQYGDDLAVVGLAFEITEDFDRSVQQVSRHHEHIGTDWPILIAGLSDKDKASESLPVLDRVRSYPTLIFLDRNNEVQGVYSGFSGPATGDAYTQQRERFEALIDSMID